MTKAPLKELLVKTARAWSEDKCARLAAAFSFFAALSIAPLLVFAVVFFGRFYGSESMAERRLLHVAAENMGQGAADFLKTLLENAHRPGAQTLAIVFSAFVALIGASSLFGELSDALATIWRVPAKHDSAIHAFFTSKVTSILMVFLFIVVVAAWLVVDSVVNYGIRNSGTFPGWPVVSLIISTAFLSGVFAVVFRSLPRRVAKWSDVWRAAIVTAFGFSLAKFCLSLYFTFADVESAYGPAGALVLILLWIYYSAQIFYFGAEMVCVYAHEYGSMVGPSREPVRNPAEALE